MIFLQQNDLEYLDVLICIDNYKNLGFEGKNFEEYVDVYVQMVTSYKSDMLISNDIEKISLFFRKFCYFEALEVGSGIVVLCEK